MDRRAFGVVACSLLLVLLSAPAAAGTFVFGTGDNPYDPGVLNQGWYHESSANSDSNDNFLVGYATGGTSEYRNFFSFDLTGMTGTPVSAVLQLGASSHTIDPLTYELFEVATAAAIVNQNHLFRPSVFADLADGASYGSFVVDRATVEPFPIVLPLDGAALVAIDAASDQWFTIGGAIVAGLDGAGDGLFAGSGGVESFLIVTTVPESETGVLLGLSITLPLACRRKAPR